MPCCRHRWSAWSGDIPCLVAEQDLQGVGDVIGRGEAAQRAAPYNCSCCSSPSTRVISVSTKPDLLASIDDGGQHPRPRDLADR